MTRPHLPALRIGSIMSVVALALAGCGGASAGKAGAVASVALPNVSPSPREHTVSALSDPAADGLPKPLVDPAEILSGGPPPDGIPAIDHPRFERARSVSWLRDREPVLALTVGGDSRAYPIQVVIWHEIVNDTVGGIPVAVTYCPLCDTAIAFDRRLGHRLLDFGTSGRLYRSDLVMYDRQTQSLWSQFIGAAIAGVLTGSQLSTLPVAIVSWADWRAAHGDGWVLSRDTGFQRDYGTNPYAGYDDVHSRPFLFQGEIDGRQPPKARLVGIHDGETAVAVLLDDLRLHHAINTQLAGRPLVVWERDGTASPLDAAAIADGRDVGATAVFDSRVDGRVLHFTSVNGIFHDLETQSTWSFVGVAVAGPLAGHSLIPVEHVDTFWFAWAAFLPHTRIVHG
jgi:uncharacterized protein DUF3179